MIAPQPKPQRMIVSSSASGLASFGRESYASSRDGAVHAHLGISRGKQVEHELVTPNANRYARISARLARQA